MAKSPDTITVERMMLRLYRSKPRNYSTRAAMENFRWGNHPAWVEVYKLTGGSLSFVKKHPVYFN